ncbi:cationic amino acid transporter 4-like [Anneissia japonica]|uniref:cationic amino acid transporter 4-like n=1 Tax=Anneissia japonica TaxID=1529436 RepID=UPI001425A9D6|nr:cationic amino acid transporter 4-like [Anneissia japonica]XP_033126204.1 cationic amino acid transporter 4-like [Anneissia japonica]XP_033126211.1 cationic amino acid transporter 4-like [Anneissia japonica]
MEVLSECFTNINRRKKIDNSEPSETFQRCLSVVDLTYIGLGSMIGTGLFVVGGEVAKSIAGPAVVISFLFGACAALLSAFCYAEFSSQVARTGSAYIYTYVSIGEIWAFAIGWNMVLEYISMISSVARAISATVDSVMDFKIKNATIEYILNGNRWESPIFEEYPDLLAGTFVVIVVLLVSLGTKLSSAVTMICINVLFIILFMIAVISFVYGDIANLTSEGGYFPYGIGGVLEGAAVCFVTYSGFEVICISSEECTTPKKSIPIALGAALGIVSLTYIIVSGSLTYLVPYGDIVPEAAFSTAFMEHGLAWMAYIVTVAIILAGFSTLITALYFLARLIYALSIDGLFFKTFSAVNATTQVPVKATITFGAICTLLSIFLKYDVLVTFLSIGTLCAYTIMSGAVIVLRYRPKSESISHYGHIDASSDGMTLYTHTNNSVHLDTDEEESIDGVRVPDKTGTLRTQFAGLSVFSGYKPGVVVPFALLGFVFFSVIGMLILNNVSDLLSSVGLTLVVIILFILSLGSFAIIPLHKHSVDTGHIQVGLVAVRYLFLSLRGIGYRVTFCVCQTGLCRLCISE